MRNPKLRSLPVLALVFAAMAAQSQTLPAPIADAIKRADEGIAKIVAIPAGQRSFANTIAALDDVTDRLNAETSLFLFLQNVSPDATVRQQSRDADEALTNWSNALFLRDDLFQAVKAAAAKETPTGIDGRLLAFTLRDFRRSGMELPKEKRDQVDALNRQINKLGIEFGTNIAEDATTLFFTKKELAGVPDAKLAQWPQTGDLYAIPLGESSFVAIISNAENEDTRHKAYIAYKRRGGQKNVDVLEQILKLRDAQAKLLGYPTTAAYEIEVRMAKTPQTVTDFYNKLRPIVRKKAQLDFNEMLAEKRRITRNGKASLYPWDQGFVQNRLMKRKYAVDGNKVAEYFPVQRVLDGLFGVTSQLYGITFKDVTAGGGPDGKPLWHPDARYYEVDDKATGKAIGHIYLDLYPRPNKYSHAACWPLVPHRILPDGSVQLPVTAVVANFTKPTATQPSLLPHSEVETLFHEFGHGIHNLVSESKYARFAGTSVERDFVEAPSQMFENWVWDAGVLNTFAKHYKTGEAIPAALLKGMLAARNVGSGLMTEHQIYYGTVDQKYHTAPGGIIDTTKTAIDTLNEVELFAGVPGTMFHSSFTHLVGYQAGYYSYLWSLVYAQDMFQRFEKLGLLSPEAGKYYREKILSRGGTMDASDMLRDFLGREPQLDAFLRHLGMPTAATP